MTLIKSISGIRGTVGGRPGDTLNPLDIVKFTSAYATFIRRTTQVKTNKIVVGRDARLSGGMVRDVVCGTLTGMGFDVVDIGLATTPTTELAVVMEKACGGIIITASHNPKMWNALKLLNERGEFLDKEEGNEVLRLAEAEDFEYAPVEGLGRCREDHTYDQKHIDLVKNLKLVDVEAIRKADFRVAIDTVNSVGGIILPKLLEQLGVRQVTGLFTEPTGDFGHNPEPLEKNLGDIKALMERGSHDVAFVVDPDVDRLAMFCEDGTMYGEEYTLVTVADYVLQHTPGNTVSNLSSTRALRDVTRRYGGTYSAAAVGEVNVVAKMKETHAVIGGEGNGGVIYPEAHYGRDALVGIALVLTYLAKTGKKMSELRATYPQYYMAKNRIDLTPDTDVDAILARVKEIYKDEEVNDVDGVKIDFADSWVHLRKSNTEPIIRVYSEARTAEAAEEIGRKVMDVVLSLRGSSIGMKKNVAMMKTWWLGLLGLLLCMGAWADGARKTCLLREGWRFIRQDHAGFADVQVDERKWERVSVPHDWAIGGPFDGRNDRQFMAIEQDGQTEAQFQSGRTGGLPFTGVGWYRLHFDVPGFGAGKRVILMFDGAMSHAQVYVNGRRAGEWPYGYNSFYFDVTDYVDATGNVLAVRLENEPESSRWYPGAGLYRNVHLVVKGAVGVRTWGTTVTTPVVREGFARVKVRTELEFPEGADVREVKLKTVLRSPSGMPVAEREAGLSSYDEGVLEQDFVVTSPQLWDVGHPNLYRADTEVYYQGRLTDADQTVFGIRTMEIVPEQGFFLNGRKLVLHGTCNHHDLGPLGTAVNEQAIRYRLKMLKDMGCNAYRTSHNMPSPELVRACDEMGMLLMVETFDEWRTKKMANGYHKYYDEWMERDLTNVVRHYRNAPSVVMWCIGNEVPDQGSAQGAKLCRRMQEIVHREDPTRPCTQGMNLVDAAIASHVAAIMDIPGLNYRSEKVQMAYGKLPQEVVLGSETASTVSSRGVYKFPVERKADARYADHQSSSYDVEHCGWSDLPEDNFILSEDLPYYMGEFVWTGFDYLGEPTPYYDDWPSHSSLFGIIDLAYLPKDRYYLYRSLWNKENETLHILPHWTWPGREGEVTPVFVYTNYPTVELFVNGKSQGRRTKDTTVDVDSTENDEARRALVRQRRYRLMWMDVRYEPGELKAVAYDAQGRKRMEQVVCTAGEPYRLVLEADKDTLDAGLRDEDLAFVTVSVVDREGNLCPGAQHEVKFSVRGAGYYKAGANGNPVCLEPFARPQMPVFNGKMTAIVAEEGEPGTIRLRASARGLKSANLVLHVVRSGQGGAKSEP